MDEFGISKDEYFMDIMDTPQLFSLEVWIEKIEISKGIHKNITDEADALEARTEKKSSSPEVNENIRDSQDGKELKKKLHNNTMLTEDYLLPSGQKPLRIKYNIFNIKQFSLGQIEFNKLFQFASTYLSESESETELVKDKDKRKSKSPGNRREQSKYKTGEIKSKSETGKKIRGSIHSKGQKKSLDWQSITKKGKKPRLSFNRQYRNSFIYNVDEILDLLDIETFLPKNECLIKKGGCLTFAMAPFKLIRLIQSGPIIATIDRFGGRLDDEGDKVGQTKIEFPSNWYETVYRTATKPSSAPVVVKTSKNAIIEENPGEVIGRMEYSLILTCYAGCIISKEMPSQIGLYVSLAEGLTSSLASVCHKPTVRQNITYQSTKRKAMDEDYEILFQPTKEQNRFS